jgi:hypothetical protein
MNYDELAKKYKRPVEAHLAKLFSHLNIGTVKVSPHGQTAVDAQSFAEEVSSIRQELVHLKSENFLLVTLMNFLIQTLTEVHQKELTKGLQAQTEAVIELLLVKLDEQKKERAKPNIVVPK